jgi:inosine-uridine nucleoside N-ribohydrolase
MKNAISGLYKRTKYSGRFTSALLREMAVICLILATFFISSFSTNKALQNKESLPTSPINVIFETDMGNDIDDALALDMLYKYADQGKVKILAISNNKNSEYSIHYIDVLNTWYGYPDIPLATVKNGTNSEGDAKDYVRAVSEFMADGKLVFKRSITNYSKVMESTRLYRKMLSQQPDNSVTIISVGFSTNLARLLDTPADEFSPLSGKELIRKKVKLLSMMAGNLLSGENKEYNVMKDPGAARKVFAQWPTPIMISPFEVGMVIHYPASSIQNDFKWTKYHPVALSFETYKTMPYDAPAWDLTAVLYAIEGNEGYFDISPAGRISVDANTFTHFQEDRQGMHRYLKINPELTGKVRARFIELITTKPKFQK